MNRRAHWEHVYESKGDAELSWFQSTPTRSLSLIDALRPRPGRVIDVGGGQSALASELVARGVEHVSVVDIASAAIERGRARPGATAEAIRWIVGDVLELRDLGRFDLWHDRAVFHFLTDPEDRRRYVAAAARAIPAGGHAIVATFALTGPEKCSGLPACRYDAALLAREFDGSFVGVESAAETHRTPWGRTQHFTYVVLRRV
jgi:2-polyprenyl-3-methyl-5-hydroxy-6-metoxy-1,4-benzoquinol methylase